MLEKRGLSEKEAQAKLKECGFNEIKETNKVSVGRILLRQVQSNFVVYLLVFAMLVSFFVGKTLTGYVLVGVILVVISTGFIQEYRAERAISHLKQMIMPVSIVIREGKEKEVLSREIVPGDILVLRNGEKVPADCIILEEKELRVNESVLTGESMDIKKNPVRNEKNYTDENMVFTGSFLVNGKCLAKVVHTGMNTKFGKIANMISTAEKELPLQKKVNLIAKYMTGIGLFFAVLTGLIMFYREPSFEMEILGAILIMVVAVAVSSFPEGFPVVLITALASGAHRMAKKNAIVNRMSIIETLGETTVICSDKTGTITKGEMTIQEIYADEKIYEVSGAGYTSEGDFKQKGLKVDVKKDSVLSLLLRAGVLCNDSSMQRSGEDGAMTLRGLPTEGALLVAAAKAGIYADDIKFSRKEEIPFSSERKMMSVVCKEGASLRVYSKGAPEYLLEKCKFIQRKDGVFRIRDKDLSKFKKIAQSMAKKSLRTLAVAYKPFGEDGKKSIEEDLIFLGIVGMEDPPRNEVFEALKLCNSAGIDVKMITGDNRETAMSIAKQIGLREGKVLDGAELDSITDEELDKIVKNVMVFARVRPEHKLRIVRALKNNGEIVTMTGDGVNDAPALKEAHIGIAMGKCGTDVSRSVADLTLKDDNFATIVDAVKEGRVIFSNIQKFAAYQTSINISQVALIFFAVLLEFPLPLVAIQILFINLFSDEITAITLAFNPYSKDIMDHKPRRKSHILSLPIVLMMILAAVVMTFGSLWLFNYSFTHGLNEDESRTIVLLTMVFFTIANAYNFRSFRKSVFGRSLIVNKYLFFASLAALIGTVLVVYLGALNKIFETSPIPIFWWFYAAGISLSIVVIFDVLKFVNNKIGFFSEDFQHFGKNSHSKRK